MVIEGDVGAKARFFARDIVGIFLKTGHKIIACGSIVSKYQ
jgi:hypothetical protein